MKKIFLIALALTTLTQSSWAILDEHKIDLKTAIEKALETNPQMQMLDMDVEISKNKTKAVNRFQNPSIDVFQSMGSAIKTEPQTVGSSLLVEVMKRGKRKQVAKVQESIALNNKNFSKYDLILEVRKAYIDLLLKKSNLNIRKQQQKLAQELYESIQKDVEAGKVPKTEALEAKIALNRSIMEVNSAKSNVIFSQNRFNTVMNTSDINYDTKEDKLNGNYLDLMTIQPTNDMLKFDEIKAFAI
ncbi:MAG: TolC family protein [Candidatus Gastranaerophilales bacterium]|nr:TolC family protein [Candidatus Gastranaerophilales bacterium]